MESSKHRRAVKREASKTSEARRLRGALRLVFVSVAALSLAGACGDSTKEKAKAAQLAQGCVLNSDCASPLVCAFERCHEECQDSRDCKLEPGQRCVLNEDDVHVCQLEDNTECEEDADCLGDQSCGVDAECRDECEDSDECVEGQACSLGSCADEEELTEDGDLPIVTGHEPDGGSGGSAGESSGGSGGSGGSSVTSGGSGGVGGSTTTTGSGGTASDPACGNGLLDTGEECDDEGTQNGDGCDADCAEEDGWVCLSGEPTVCEDVNECSDGTATCHADAACTNIPSSFECECNEGFVGNGYDCEDACEADPSTCSLPVEQVVAGDNHTCALLEGGAVRCWGYANGALGYGNSNSIGDNELPTADVNVGGTVVQLAAGGAHTCALLANGTVRCWGTNNYGELGINDGNETIGDNEVPGSIDPVNVGGEVTQIATSTYHTCALLTSGAVRCWGYGAYGQLGYGNSTQIGDDEDPADAGNVPLGGNAKYIAVGGSHTCAIMEDGAVRCWGQGSYGQLGYGDTAAVGTANTPADVGDIVLGGEAVSLSLGTYHSCALLTTGNVVCWGYGQYGSLGYGDTNNQGDGENPSFEGAVAVGASVTAVSCNDYNTCVVLEDGGVLCWGQNSYGELGQGDTVQIGDDEEPDSLDPIVLGDTAESLAVGANHVCALTSSANVRCWGYGPYLGYGNSTTIGDDENPSVAGPVELL